MQLDASGRIEAWLPWAGNHARGGGGSWSTLGVVAGRRGGGGELGNCEQEVGVMSSVNVLKTLRPLRFVSFQLLILSS